MTEDHFVNSSNNNQTGKKEVGIFKSWIEILSEEDKKI